MPTIAALTSFSSNTLIKAAEVNSNFSTIRTTVNTYAAFVDAAATITGAWTFSTAPTFSNAQTFAAGVTITSGGLTVSAGGITVTGNSTITGTLGGLTGLTVASGGFTVTGNSSVSGTLTATTFSGSGASLTNIPAAQITGTLAAMSGANLTNLNATNISSGTLNASRLPTALGAHSIASLTVGPFTSTNAAFAFGSSAVAVSTSTGSATNASPGFGSPLPDGTEYFSTGGGQAACLWLRITDDAGREGFIPYFRRAF